MANTASLHTHQFIVSDDERSQRLDRWLLSYFPQNSRNEIQRWIKEGLVEVDEKTAKASLKLTSGQAVKVTLPPPIDSRLLPEEIPLDIIFENEDVILLNKPAGMVVHPAAGHASGTLVHAVLHHAPEIQGVGGERRPGIVHRLDKETSGLMVVAKNGISHRFFQQQFHARTVYKEYLALLEGRIEPASDRIDVLLGRHPVHRKRQTVLSSDPMKDGAPGRRATTDYERLAIYSTSVRDDAGTAHFSFVRAILHTGRTHQIRVHFAWRKHPVVGDSLYGYRRQRLQLNRHFLHAHRMRIRLPGETEPREFVAPLPPELETVLTTLNEETQQ